MNTPRTNYISNRLLKMDHESGMTILQGARRYWTDKIHASKLHPVLLTHACETVQNARGSLAIRRQVRPLYEVDDLFVWFPAGLMPIVLSELRIRDFRRRARLPM